MISGKDVRIENGYIIINGEKHPIVQDVSELEEVSGEIVLNTDGGWLFDTQAGENKVYKQGGIAWLSAYIYNSGVLTRDTVYEVGTLPSEFIPSKEHKVPMYQGTSTGSLRGILNIKTTGKIEFRSVDGNQFAISTTIMYPLD